MSDMVFLLLCAGLLLSCEKQPDRTVTVARVAHNDAEIAQIAEDARSTLPVFFRYVNRTDGERDHCYIKCPFAADEGSDINAEQIWLTGIHYKNGSYLGVIASTPRYVSGMKKGNTVAFNIDAITDWMYVKGGKIIGGESIKCLVERMPEDQRGETERELLRMFF